MIVKMRQAIYLYLSLLWLFIAITKINCECPDDSLLAPCSCQGDEHITCGGDKPINFCEIFPKLAKTLKDNQKDLEMFILSNSAVEEIPDNCFDDIYFREIRIQNAKNLKKIHPNAFKGTDQLVERFLLINSPLFESNTPTHIFDILNKFKKLDAVSISDIGLKEIPSNAFQPHDSLVWLHISGKSIEKINENAFASLNSLIEIHITDTSISEVPKGVFAFSKSEGPLEICLYNNQKITAVNEQAFTQTGRPTTLDFSGERFSTQIFAKQMPVLEEKIFKQFFAENELNKIEMVGQLFDCNECKNAWIKKDAKILERVINLKCADGKEVADSFASCK